MDVPLLIEEAGGVGSSGRDADETVGSAGRSSNLKSILRLMSPRTRDERDRRREKFDVPPSIPETYPPRVPPVLIPSGICGRTPGSAQSPSSGSHKPWPGSPEETLETGVSRSEVSCNHDGEGLEARVLEEEGRDQKGRESTSGYIGLSVVDEEMAMDSGYQDIPEKAIGTSFGSRSTNNFSSTEDDTHDDSLSPSDWSEPSTSVPNLERVDLVEAKSKFKRSKRFVKPLQKCKTAPVLNNIKQATNGAESNKKEAKAAISADSVVWQATAGLLIYLFVGVMIYAWKKEEFKGVKTVSVVDALYFCIVTMCTIGYGDISPVTPTAKLLACALVLVGFGFIDALMSGMLTFVLDRQERILMHVVEDGNHEKAKSYVLNREKGTMRVRLKVFFAVGTVFLSVSAGTLFLHFVEELNWIDSVYVTIISITTVGFGDYSFQTMWGRLFAALWLLLSTLGVARAFLFLAEARVHKRQRHFAKNILQRKLTKTDLLEADIDNDGHVSKSEYIVYKLKEMGKISTKDIVEICHEFEQIDTMGVGKITMAQLLEAE